MLEISMHVFSVILASHVIQAVKVFVRHIAEQDSSVLMQKRFRVELGIFLESLNERGKPPQATVAPHFAKPFGITSIASKPR